MSDFTNSCLTSSSVAFVEMLSRSSTHLRIDSQSALRIYKYLINKLEGEVGVVKDLDEQKKSIKTKISLLDEILKFLILEYFSQSVYSIVRVT